MSKCDLKKVVSSVFTSLLYLQSWLIVGLGLYVTFVWRVPRMEQIMLTLPEHMMIPPVFVGVHTASALFFLWCSCSIPFICFVLVISIVSFCVISVSLCFLDLWFS